MFRSLALAVCAAVVCLGQSTPEQKLAREIYKELIEINTSFSTGKTTPAAEAVARRLKALGFDQVDVLGAAPHKMNVIARLKGTGEKKPLLLLAHLDVVEAKREDWSMDPFTLHEKDGYFYGRGSGDDKAQAAIWVANLIRYKQEGYRPKRDLIVALTADEEGGGPYNGVDWLLKNRRDLIDAEFCLNEGGWGDMRNGKKLYNAIQVSEKMSQTYRLEVRNPGGHSSVPVKENAIYHLAAALLKIQQYEFPIDFNEVTKAQFTRTGKVVGGPMGEALQLAASGDAEAAKAVAAASPTYNAMMRTTCVATMLEGGHAFNALPQLAAASVNCRIVPGVSAEKVQQKLKRVIGDEQVVVSTVNNLGGGPASPLRDDVLAATEKATDEVWPGVPVVPIMVMGGTDGAFLRKEGIPTYGVMGLFMEQSDMRFHGRDERIPVASFYEAQTFLYKLVKELSQ